MATVGEIEKLYTCAICLEIYSDPMRISCGHVFCAVCLSGYKSAGQKQCPICRQPFQGQTVKDVTMSSQILTVLGTCEDCDKQMVLSSMRTHAATCPKKNKPIPKFKPVGETTQPIPSVPNRSTFQCPHCTEKNLDIQGLVKHCNDQHQQAPQQVVCPICASMPWGDSTMTSNNLLQHLNMRHKFEYDTYVDYSVDDDDMLQAAIQASLEQ